MSTGSVLDNLRMTRFQISAITICMAINMLDGFHVLVIAFTTSAIAADWQLSATAIGSLLSAGLVGMAIGSIALGPLADRPSGAGMPGFNQPGNVVISGHAEYGAMEQSSTGRILEYDPAKKKTRVIAKGLSFANGVALSRDQKSLFVAETGIYRRWPRGCRPARPVRHVSTKCRRDGDS